MDTKDTQMSRNYQFRDSEEIYFVSFATVFWIDIFTRNRYRNIFLESIRFCQKEKGLEVYAWCLMTNHVHLIISSHDKPLSDILRDLKKYTSVKIIEDIEANSQESRQEWFLWMFSYAGKKNSNNTTYQFWQQNNYPIELNNVKMCQEKLEYIHQNPVVAGFVDNARDWLYSSARDYEEEQGLLDILYLL